MMVVERPVFVVGTPRSGTTLTARLLGAHSQLFMPGETHYFDDIHSRKSELGDPGSAPGAEAIATRLMSLYGRYNEPDDQDRVDRLFDTETLASDIRTKCDSYGESLQLFMRQQMQAEGKCIWGNNTPRDLFNLQEIASFFPDAKLVICIRDPRDFLGSYKGKWRNTALEEVGRLRKLYHPVVTSLLWKANMQRVSDAYRWFPEDQVLCVRYEDLVRQPEFTVRKLCAHVGLQFESGMLQTNFSNSSSGKNESQAIFTSSLDLWKRRISPEEAWVAQKMCRAAMRKYGYQTEALGVRYSKIAYIFAGTPFKLWSALLANRHKRGPLIPYLFKRMGLR